MPIEVEINLRIPRVKAPVLDANGYPIDNGSVRFIKLISVPELPKPGVSLELTTSAGHVFQGEVTKADWHDAKERFVVYCKYANRSIPADQCAALFNDSEWHMKPLL